MYSKRRKYEFKYKYYKINAGYIKSMHYNKNFYYLKVKKESDITASQIKKWFENKTVLKVYYVEECTEEEYKKGIYKLNE